MNVGRFATATAAPAVGQPWPQVGVAQRFTAHGSAASAVAGIDPRQRADGRPVGTIGLIGQYRDVTALREVLGDAERWLVERGARVLRCPVNGTIWHGHRAVIDMFAGEGGAPPYPMEPTNDRRLPQVLRQLGWQPADLAVSYLVPIAAWLAAAGHAEGLLAAGGFRDRPLSVARFEHEVEAVHGIALEAFASNWGFSPITAAELAQIYAPLIGLARTESVRILEDRDGVPVGFFFGYGEPPPTDDRTQAPRFVAKTLAVLPRVARSNPGVGVGLAIAAHRRALERGFRDSVFALAGERAFPFRVGKRRGTLMRRYATFEKAATRR